MKEASTRYFSIDAFKMIASQLVVLHHIAAYGPIADAVQLSSPALISWLYDYARMAVQIFFVIGGYLAARSMIPCGSNISSLSLALMGRYFRLAIPFVIALIFAIACATLARYWMADDFIPATPSLPQFLAHVFFLQGVLNFDTILAGAWFIAIDFQLFLLMTCIVWLGGKAANSKSVIMAIITLISASSLFWFNRSARFDDWAVYFFGAYAMGASAYWAGQRGQINVFWLWLNTALAGVALVVDFRARILIAIFVAIMLHLSKGVNLNPTFIGYQVVHYLGQISFSLFLIHFSILMLVNAIFSNLNFFNPLLGPIFMFATILLSLVAANIFYHWVEMPIAKMVKNKLKP
jgi:peptidoglycan/LPS O-acetylase OafA/YrhL